MNTAAILIFYKKFIKSIWVLPVILLLPLILFTALGISGSSIGSYNTFFYDTTKKDPDLILGGPKSIRSDEWLVTTQQTIAQSEAGFPRVNKNIGDGQDVSTTDVPYKEWSTIFKPQNLAFFVLPFENAFAFKWWFMAYLLILSCYLFVLKILPGKRLFASLLSIALFFSAFIQWWYTYGTLGSLYYSLFIGVAVLSLVSSKTKKSKILFAILLTYLSACFILVLYPPFQVACGIVMATFLIGYLASMRRARERVFNIQNIVLVGISLLISLLIAGTFIFTRLDVVKTIGNTVYPGKRSAQSGKFFIRHFFSSHLGQEFSTEKQTAQYLIDDKGRSNQSEASNFLLLTPFLFIPSLFLLIRQFKLKRSFDWGLLSMNGLFLIFMAHLFIHEFTPIARLIKLDQVADGRLLIGFGLLNIITLVLVIRNMITNKVRINSKYAILYCFLIGAIQFYLGLHAYIEFGDFIRLRWVILYSIPIPLAMYFILKARYTFAVLVYACFSIYIGIGVNPLYRNFTTIKDNPLSTFVEQEGSSSNEYWVSQGGYLQNFASMNGEPTLSGIYNYPQFSVWKNIPGVDSYNFNRYAHVGFNVTDDAPAVPVLKLISPDSFTVNLNPCSSFLKEKNVGFIISANILQSSCVSKEKTFSYPTMTIYVYDVL